jgi:hypothetical protein
MTAGPAENAAAAQAEAAGMEASAAHRQWAESTHPTGSDTAVESPTSHGVDWPGAGGGVPDPGLPEPPVVDNLSDRNP